jgi:Transposase domain (DUF772)
MLRFAGGRVESLLDELLPVEVRELPATWPCWIGCWLTGGCWGPLEHAGEGAARGHGLPTIPIACFVRLMVIKQRTGWGCKTLVREVSDSLHLRRFCLLPLTVGVPNERTSMPAPLGTRSLRTHPFAPNARQRPGVTRVGTALSPRYLISRGAALRVAPVPG